MGPPRERSSEMLKYWGFEPNWSRLRTSYCTSRFNSLTISHHNPQQKRS